jgi:hypothetical protein
VKSVEQVAVVQVGATFLRVYLLTADSPMLQQNLFVLSPASDSKLPEIKDS